MLEPKLCIIQMSPSESQMDDSILIVNESTLIGNNFLWEEFQGSCEKVKGISEQQCGEKSIIWSVGNSTTGKSQLYLMWEVNIEGKPIAS